jgi:hypothetical protein
VLEVIVFIPVGTVSLIACVKKLSYPDYFTNIERNIGSLVDEQFLDLTLHKPLLEPQCSGR